MLHTARDAGEPAQIVIVWNVTAYHPGINWYKIKNLVDGIGGKYIFNVFFPPPEFIFQNKEYDGLDIEFDRIKLISDIPELTYRAILRYIHTLIKLLHR